MKQLHYRRTSRNNNIEQSDLHLWKRRWVKLACKWRMPISQVCKEKEQSKLDTVGNAQTRTIKGVFMFGSAEQTVAETTCSLPTLQE